MRTIRADFGDAYDTAYALVSEPDDQQYLRSVQYRDGANLNARARLHQRHSTSPISWFEFLVGLVDWTAATDVLDVGCGTGLIWPAIDAAVSQQLVVTLTDLSAGMVEEAAQRFDAFTNAALARAEVADVQSLPFDDDSFDVVLANHMLYHVPDRAQAVRELRRVLRPTGVLVAGTNGMDATKELDDLVSHSNGVTYAQNFGRENGADILGASFGRVQWHQHVDSIRCTNADDLVAYVASLAPEAITDDEIAGVRAQVIAVMEANDGVFALTKDTGAFVARDLRRVPVKR